MTDSSASAPSVAGPPSRLHLRLAPDGMRAFASVAHGPPMAAEEIDAALASAGVVCGIDDGSRSALISAVASEAAHAEIEIARGRAAGPSNDGWFEPAFRPGLQPGHVRHDGSLDYHDRELLKPVAPGVVIGRLHPPMEGLPGCRVDGTPIAAEPGRACALEIGEGTEWLADGRVLAARAGVVVYVEGRSIAIATQYVHEGDVDLHSGDLFMQGSLVVRSDVHRGFVARATGDLEIRGGVEGGSAYAGANLRVYGGVRGGEGSMVAAGGDLRARHVERARLSSGGVLEVGDAVNSDLAAVQIRIDRALRGGRAAVEVGLVTRDAGTATATTDTVIEAGVPREAPEADARTVLESAKAERMAVRYGGGNSLAPHGKGGRHARELAGVQRGALARKIERAQRIAALLPHAFVEVRGTAHPGVHIRIGDARVVLDKAMRKVRFTLDLERRIIRAEGISS
jgi:uncharacterized protein (DUF342 family)